MPGTRSISPVPGPVPSTHRDSGGIIIPTPQATYKRPLRLYKNTLYNKRQSMAGPIGAPLEAILQIKSSPGKEISSVSDVSPTFGSVGPTPPGTSQCRPHQTARLGKNAFRGEKLPNPEPHRPLESSSGGGNSMRDPTRKVWFLKSPYGCLGSGSS